MILKNYFKVIYGEFNPLWFKQYARWLADRYLNKDMKIIELGNGLGIVTKELQELGYDIKGYDYPQINLEKKLPFESNYYDVVLCQSVIEHLRNIFTITEETNRILKKGGIAIFQTGNTLKQFTDWLKDPTPFVPKRMENLFLLHGFEVIKIRDWRNIPYIWRWTLKAFDYNWFFPRSFMGIFKK